jgi:hypothetical protein
MTKNMPTYLNFSVGIRVQKLKPNLSKRKRGNLQIHIWAGSLELGQGSVGRKRIQEKVENASAIIRLQDNPGSIGIGDSKHRNVLHPIFNLLD